MPRGDKACGGCSAYEAEPPHTASASPWQAENFRRVVIAADATQSERRGSFTLTVWAEDGTRSLTLTGVTFP